MSTNRLARSYYAAKCTRQLQELAAFDDLLREDCQRGFRGYVAIGGSDRRLTATDFRDMQFWSRVYVVSFFSQVDGLMSMMRAAALSLSEFGYTRLSTAEQAFLANRRYDRDLDQVAEGVRFPGTLEALEGSPPLFLRTFQSDWRPKLVGNGYVDFLDALAARNRVYHPTTVEDLDVTGDRMTLTARAIAWFTELVGKTVKEASNGIRRWVIE